VTVSTLHGAKGLEWPVTVLYEIDSAHKPSAFGVHLESDRERFDFSDPLGGRWIRYWPDPYAPQSKTELHGAVRNSLEHAKVANREERETLRLLYVGWTRARDLLVLAGKQGKIVGETLGLLRDAAGHTLIGEPEVSCTWAGRPVKARIREAVPVALAPRTPELGRGYTAAGPREHPPASVNISSIAQTGVIKKVEVIGTPLVVQPHTDWQAFGNAVHAFFAADVPGLETAERLALATALLARCEVGEAVQADALLAASDALRAWAEQRWGAAAWHREWPLKMRQESGTELVGYADTMIMSSDSFALVDYKCIGSTRDEALEAAAGCHRTLKCGH
jgi:ATP-dependent exoDNAse (exonuclease V) beta subunit